MATRYVDVSTGVIVTGKSNSEQVTIVHCIGVMGRPVVVMAMGAFPRHGACLRHPHLLCKLSRHHRCGVLGLSPSRSGTNFFIAVYSVGGLNDLV